MACWPVPAMPEGWEIVGKQGSGGPQSGGPFPCQDTQACGRCSQVPRPTWPGARSVCVHIFHLQTKSTVQAHSSPPPCHTLWRAEFTDKEMRALHSSHLNGA